MWIDEPKKPLTTVYKRRSQWLSRVSQRISGCCCFESALELAGFYTLRAKEITTGVNTGKEEGQLP